jgi:hypothetical protein
MTQTGEQEFAEDAGTRTQASLRGPRLEGVWDVAEAAKAFADVKKPSRPITPDP